MAERAKDYIAHGSPQHAAFLNLKKATGKDEPLEHKGWTLADPTIYGPNARPEFLQAVLVQRVNELETAPTVPPNAPAMFTPPAQVPPNAS